MPLERDGRQGAFFNPPWGRLLVSNPTVASTSAAHRRFKFPCGLQQSSVHWNHAFVHSKCQVKRMCERSELARLTAMTSRVIHSFPPTDHFPDRS